MESLSRKVAAIFSFRKCLFVVNITLFWYSTWSFKLVFLNILLATDPQRYVWQPFSMFSSHTDTVLTMVPWHLFHIQ